MGLATYVDESFDADEYFLGALIADSEEAHALGKGIDDLMRAIHDEYGVSASTELHGYELFHGTGGWDSLHPLPKARVSIFGRVIELICAHDVTLRVQRISARGLARNYTTPWPSEKVAWQFLLQQINEHAVGLHTTTFVIADELNSHEARRLALSDYRERGTPGGWRSSTMPNISDTILFVPSHHSRMIQAVDLVTFIAHRHKRHPFADVRSVAAVEKLYGTLEAKGLICAGPWP